MVSRQKLVKYFLEFDFFIDYFLVKIFKQSQTLLANKCLLNLPKNY